MKTIKIKELNLEVELKETQKGIPFNKIKIPKGWRLLTGAEAMFLWENYRNKIDLDWFFVKPIRDYPVAGFIAFEDGAFLICGRFPADSNDRLGVRFCREIKKDER
jgi:hypothetical protein